MNVLATVRGDIADYLSTLIYIYTLLIIAHIIVQWVFAFGVRIPYSRTSDAVLKFLRDVCEPFLRIFRRIIPQVGPIDFSAMVAIITLALINSVVVQGILAG